MTDQGPNSGQRRALLIGTGEYEHPALGALLSPEVDCSSLAEVLRDPDIGPFEVQQLVDVDRATLERAIEEFFFSAQRDDICLLYLSCHGIVSRNDKLYFAVRNTDPDRPAHSSISARFVHDLMDDCRARSIVVVLDCCYSGLFIPGAKGDGSANFEEALAGHGRVIITAGSGSQIAWEGDHADAPAPSRFTGMLVEGLRSGDADLNGDGLITVQELYRYVYERLHREGVGQTPRMGGVVQYEIALAKVKKKRRQRASRKARTDGPDRRSRSVQGRPQTEEPWRMPVASGSARQPVLSDGVLAVHEGYSLHVVDAVTRRRCPLIQTNYPGSPAFHGGAVYFPGQGGWLRVVDLRTGKPRRAIRVKVRDGQLGVCANVLYAPSPDGNLHAIDLISGTVRWSQSLLGLNMIRPPETAAGNVICMVSGPRRVGEAADSGEVRIMAVEGTTGEQHWSYQAEEPLSPEWVVTDRAVYVAEQVEPSRQRIVAVDSVNGIPLWSFDTTANLAVAPAVVNGTLFIGDAANRLIAINAVSGDRLWEKKTKGRLITRPFGADETLFTADRAANLTAWKISSGRKLRTHDVSLSPDRQGRPAVGDHVVYLTDSRGDLRALPTQQPLGV